MSDSLAPLSEVCGAFLVSPLAQFWLLGYVDVLHQASAWSRLNPKYLANFEHSRESPDKQLCFCFSANGFVGWAALRLRFRGQGLKWRPPSHQRHPMHHLRPNGGVDFSIQHWTSLSNCGLRRARRVASLLLMGRLTS
jgi:hypothetical protein